MNNTVMKLIALALVIISFAFICCACTSSLEENAISTLTTTSAPVVTANTTHTSRPASTYKSSFSNKYGTATTKCAHSGCSNYIATSGDTNCCTKHSNRCIGCNCYIDEDALMCVTCIANALD